MGPVLPKTEVRMGQFSPRDVPRWDTHTQGCTQVGYTPERYTGGIYTPERYTGGIYTP